MKLRGLRYMSLISCIQIAKRATRRQTAGQALVELALTVTFLAMLFSAAVDLGLAYKSYQTLLNASAEASNYLAKNPVVNCADYTCPDSTPSGGADREARIRFRNEQGSVVRGTASTLDLDSDGKDDLTQNSYGWGWVEARVRIDEADSNQVSITNSNFATVTDGFDPSQTNAECRDRSPLDNNGLQCYIVVRTQIDYRPFAIAPAVGQIMTIRAISVMPIVQNQ